MLAVLLTCLLVAYILFDVNYFVRMFLTCAIARYFRSKIGLLDTNVTYGIVLPWDVDTNLDHMNNARIVREFDFGRMELGVRTKTAEWVLEKGGGFPVNANFIRYRLPVKLFSIFKVESKVMSWDNKNLYIQQTLTTLKDGIVRAVAYPKIYTAGWNTQDFTSEVWPGLSSPEMPKEFDNMGEIGEIVSERYSKKGNNNQGNGFLENIHPEYNSRNYNKAKSR